MNWAGIRVSEPSRSGELLRRQPHRSGRFSSARPHEGSPGLLEPHFLHGLAGALDERPDVFRRAHGGGSGGANRTRQRSSTLLGSECWSGSTNQDYGNRSREEASLRSRPILPGHCFHGYSRSMVGQWLPTWPCYGVRACGRQAVNRPPGRGCQGVNARGGSISQRASPVPGNQDHGMAAR